ncbi:MAG TPA: class III extradiol ring-cleavage dioxygenase [Alphaproteobacteria bacterium]|nr:class III extradiol ring-cleavage dioxygenase [Alphaproteobacteria bacterium]
MTQRISPVFVSHGAPTLVLEDHPARHFLARLGREMERPRAILCVSAHWETAEPTVSLAERPATIHDFYGFPEELYRMTYPAPGAPDLARRGAELLRTAGLPCREDPDRGLDHGAWSPLILIYPKADIPVTQLSIQPGRGPEHHLAVGRALETLPEEGILILASGGAVHNLSQFRVDRRTPAQWATQFEEWLTQRLLEGDAAALIGYEGLEEGAKAHPTDDHFLPLFVALGAAGEGARGRALHRSFAHGSLAMSAYAMESAAA